MLTNHEAAGFAKAPSVTVVPVRPPVALIQTVGAGSGQTTPALHHAGLMSEPAAILLLGVLLVGLAFGIRGQRT